MKIPIARREQPWYNSKKAPKTAPVGGKSGSMAGKLQGDDIMASKIDLHTHTTASDGTLTPGALVSRAKVVGLEALAITDHDTMAGVPEALAAGVALGVEVLAGIEISTDYGGTDTHVLGYGLRPDAPELRPVLDWVQQDRRRRNARIAERMNRDGIRVSLAELEAQNPGATIGRPHFARVLVEQGLAQSVSDAFHRFLNPGKCYYLPRTYLPMAQAVEIICRSGGVAVLAHPLQYGYSTEKLRQLVSDAAGLGIVGMEIYYTGYTPQQREMLTELSREFGLFATGGSDFHGENKPQIVLGALNVPEQCLNELRAKLGQVES